MELKQNELMDFIVSMKEKKKELKKNLASQKQRINECFQEVRNCIDFYQKQAEKIVQDQFAKMIGEIETYTGDSKMKASHLEEQNQDLHNRLRIMSTYCYSSYIV